MDADKVFIIVNDKRISITAFLAMERETIKTVDASGCTALTSLGELPAAKTVDARGCTALTSYIEVGENARGYLMYGVKIAGQW